MARSAKRADAAPRGRPARKRDGFIRRLIVRHPGIAGGLTAFVVALSYISANAIWYQPHAQENVFFATRPAPLANRPAAEPDPETTFNILRPEEAPAPVADPALRQVQDSLKALGLYEGAVDGLNGPATRTAIEAYRRSAGLPASGGLDAALMARLVSPGTTAGIPARKAAPTPQEVTANADIRKIQAGLRAFGNDLIEIDGVPGARTQAALREFQKLFGLKRTGEPDHAVLAKMQEIGLID